MNRKSVNITRVDTIGNPVNDAFESLMRNHGSSVFDQGMSHTYAAQSVIFHQDTQPQAVYLIDRGIVKLVRIMETGQPMILGLRRRHWLIGAPSVLLDSMYYSTAITLVPTSLRCISARDFLSLTKTSEDFSRYVHLLLSEEIIKQMKYVEARNCLKTRDRIRHLLLELVEDQELAGGGSSGFSLPLTNKELSQLLAITPEHLCRVLKEMKQEGLIRYANGNLTVTNPTRLI